MSRVFGAILQRDHAFKLVNLMSRIKIHTLVQRLTMEMRSPRMGQMMYLVVGMPMFSLNVVPLHSEVRILVEHH